MPSSKPLHPTGINPYLWTPAGPRFLGDLPFEVGEWKPEFLGTFEFPATEPARFDSVEDCSSRRIEERRSLVYVDKNLTVCSDSSHD